LGGRIESEREERGDAEPDPQRAAGKFEYRNPKSETNSNQKTEMI